MNKFFLELFCYQINFLYLGGIQNNDILIDIPGKKLSFTFVRYTY